MIKYLSIILGLSLFFACSETPLPIHFIRHLNRAKMVFVEPDGFKRIDSLQKSSMSWELTYLHPYEKFEVRYDIQPMDVMLKEFKELEARQDSGEILIHPNKLFNNSFKEALHKISDGQSSEYNIFSSNAIVGEFNADWGATATINAGEEFGRGYKYCYFVFIHKNNLGDAYIYCLADDLKILNKEMMKIIHNLKFSH
jgi:hypothetical protein